MPTHSSPKCVGLNIHVRFIANSVARYCDLRGNQGPFEKSCRGLSYCLYILKVYLIRIFEFRPNLFKAEFRLSQRCCIGEGFWNNNIIQIFNLVIFALIGNGDQI